MHRAELRPRSDYIREVDELVVVAVFYTSREPGDVIWLTESVYLHKSLAGGALGRRDNLIRFDLVRLRHLFTERDCR